jgi:hypothetical protein
MEQEVAKAVAECKGLGPKLFVAKQRRKFVNYARQFLVAGCQA